MTLPAATEEKTESYGLAFRFTVAAFAVSVLGTAGSLYLSLGMGLKACPLCFYQRSFMMSAAVVLGSSLWLDGCRSTRACLIALPLVWAGLGVAVFHQYLVWSGTLECPAALFGWGGAPAQSLALFLLLTGLCVAGAWQDWHADRPRHAVMITASVVLGLAISWACIASAPPLPPRPTQPYDPVKQPLDMCRPPFGPARP